MKQKLLIFAAALFIGIQSYAQNGVAINTTGADADNSAILDVSSTNKGFLPPRMTSGKRDAISSPAAGLLVWCSNCGAKGEMQVYNGTEWTNMIGGPASAGTFSCGDNFKDSRDNKTYSTVLIGTQCWMAQNLNVGTKITGATAQTSNSTIEKYCYNDNDANCNIYGGLYQWAEAMQYYNGATNSATWNPAPSGNVKGICPDGWHIPTSSEWTTLKTYLGDGAGGKMKSTDTNLWESPNTGADNSSGFTGLPGGYRNSSGGFTEVGISGNSWAATEWLESTYGWAFNLYNNSATNGQGGSGKALGFSVRCVKD